MRVEICRNATVLYQEAQFHLAAERRRGEVGRRDQNGVMSAMAVFACIDVALGGTCLLSSGHS
jgi:hypothetical protein